MTPGLAEIRDLPKIALHDHLDGGVRPQTVLELASEIGHALPASDSAALGEWFFEAADSGSLPRYLETFEHTVAVMQTPDALHRIAREFVEDQAADGVIYAEARWAPELHVTGGLSMAEAVDAVRAGLAEGVEVCSRRGEMIHVGQLLCAMRHLDRSTEVAELAIERLGEADGDVCGFDLAGPEAGFPPSNHAVALAAVRGAGVPITLHAGEADGPDSIRDALDQGAQRLGHGVRIIEDVHGDELGETATRVLEGEIPLEVCPTSNLQTGVARSYADHPVGRLAELGFTVTISCDNRLMSRTTLTNELFQTLTAHDLGLEALQSFQENAARAAFVTEEVRSALLGRIRQGFVRA